MKRLIPTNARSLMAIITLTALAALSVVRFNIIALGQEPEKPALQARQAQAAADNELKSVRKKKARAKAAKKEQAQPAQKAPIEGLPKDFEEQQRQAFEQLEDRELSFKEFLGGATQEFVRQRALQLDPKLAYLPFPPNAAPKLHKTCENGDFEIVGKTSPINPAEWSGGHGSVGSSGVINYGSFTSGFFWGALTNPNAHQTIVTAGIDPNVGINMTGPNVGLNNVPSGHAVRIGNAKASNGAELLSKTFVVTSSDKVIRFWYAAVLVHSTAPWANVHSLAVQPAFEVRVITSSGSVPGLVNLGNNNSKLTGNDPTLKHLPSPNIAYQDWTCAQIDLSTLVGQTVTIEFVTKDCSFGGCWCYAYIDNFCGACQCNCLEQGPCCLDKNLVLSEPFEKPGVPIHSDYKEVPGADSLVPGTYIKYPVELIEKACQNWQLPKACGSTKDFSGQGMLVNGLTNQPGGTVSTVWSRPLDLKPGEYRVCFRYLPLPQCCFDIKAKPSLIVSGSNGPISFSSMSDVDTGCGHLYTATFTGSGSVNLQIVLRGDGKGDGNDLLLDNICVSGGPHGLVPERAD